MTIEDRLNRAIGALQAIAGVRHLDQASDIAIRILLLESNETIDEYGKEALIEQRAQARTYAKRFLDETETEVLSPAYGA